MNDITYDATMLTETPSGNQPTRTAADDDTGLERQMAELGLSDETRRFLRNLHQAEKQINAAFSKSRQGGGLEDRVSQVYRDLYGAGCSVRGSR